MSIHCQSFPVYPRIQSSEEIKSYYIHAEFTPIDQEKHTLLLLHGYLGSVEDYSTIMEKYEKYYNVIALDLRGHGESDSPLEGSWTIDDFTFDIYQVITQLLPSNQKISIIASSMSTAIALKMASDYPEFVDRLLLISPTDQFSIPIWGKFLLSIGKLTPNIIAKGLIEMYGLFGSAFTFDKEEKSYVKEAYNRIRRIDIDTHKKILQETIGSWQINIDNITLPILIVAGEFDNVVPFNNSVELNNKLLDSTLIVLRNTKHHILVLRTDTLIHIMDLWLDGDNYLTNSRMHYEESILNNIIY
ncbi:MAG: alpha/beta fold hydrolase [Candidatus Kariarchaeaceae archaeon]|jgi:pimeloyl-ACP methyl ester carboxylesterase